MEYIGKQISKKESVAKHAEHIKENEICFATSDGNCFAGAKAKNTAHSHSALYKPALLVFDLHSKDESDDRNSEEKPAHRGRESQETESNNGGDVELTLESLMKLTVSVLKAKATELEVEFESDANKRTIANAIIDSVSE
jgi:hypothetical protein